MHYKEHILEIGRKWQSKETGFMQMCYHSDSRDTIPIRENLCFTLALLRSRLADNIYEAQEKLRRLLSYQVDGNFPIYLHEYPVCYDRWFVVEVLPTLIWMIKGFHHVLGVELKTKLKNSIIEGIAYTLRLMEDHSADYLTALRVGCSIKSAGKYFENNQWIEQGSSMIQQVESLGVQPAWFFSDHLGHILASLNMDAIWPSFWNHCRKMYHKELSVYCGPQIAEKQLCENPEPTLFNLYMDDYPHSQERLPLLIQGALIHSFEKPSIEKVVSKGEFASQNWEVVKEKDYVYCLIDQQESFLSTHKNIFSPVNFIWGDAKSLHSLVAQGGNIACSTFSRRENEVEFFMTLAEEVEKDHPKDHAEVVFYCSRSDTRISINEKRATLFELGNSVRIHSSKSVALVFSLEEGKGDFTGHLSVGNRPSQIKSEGDAYDWKITLRSVRRSSLCVIKVKLTLDG